MSKKHIPVGMVKDRPFNLPVDGVTQTFAFIGRKGSGKSFSAGKIVEGIYAAGAQVIVLDSVGNWYGLRIAANGKDPGLDIPILGGLRGDIPLEATAGKLIADTAIETGKSLVLDISQFSKADRQRFAFDFGERLWSKKKAEQHPTPLHLVIEESQLIVPENLGTFEKAFAARMLGTYEEIIRLGRNYGIGVSMITQRPQSVNKEVLNQTECLFVFQITGYHERDALKKWIVHQGMDPKLTDQLPSLQVGNAYVWSPQWLEVLEKVQVGKKSTFDSTATPKVGETVRRVNPKPLNLDDLRTRMSATIKQFEADDPKSLRKRNAELERQHAELMRQIERRAVERKEHKAIERSVITKEDWEKLRKEIDWVESFIAGTTKNLEAAQSACGATERTLKKLEEIARDLKVKIQGSQSKAEQIARKISEQTVNNTHKRNFGMPTVIKTINPNPELTAAQKRVLNALAWWENIGVSAPTRGQVGFVAKIKPTGGYFSNTIGPLSTNGYVEASGGNLKLTELGRQNASFPDKAPTLEEYHKSIKEVLKVNSQRRVVEAILEANGEPISVEDIGQAANINPAGGYFSNTVGPLSTLGLIERRDGIVHPTELLFPKNLT